MTTTGRGVRGEQTLSSETTRVPEPSSTHLRGAAQRPHGARCRVHLLQSLDSGAAYRNRTDDLLITRANEEVFDEVWE